MSYSSIFQFRPDVAHRIVFGTLAYSAQGYAIQTERGAIGIHRAEAGRLKLTPQAAGILISAKEITGFYKDHQRPGHYGWAANGSIVLSWYPAAVA
ncbi:hypothetical protein [Leptolyngbya sp. FACHB-261]|uniref:hypothetical protein n=1 Tax=Leptolyngbya sp. FACHB-261 TaxID=2692806 RepID=UPI001685833D|nr:hypothetical protein [Leptolyngbya sp. FACHB-261]MBD2101525.1 hypothetical protein [Leptolyngbya sp. FACHB-261]